MKLRRFVKKHTQDVQQASREAEAAKHSAEQTKAHWDVVRRTVNTSREIREANGWTESIIDIFGGRT